MFRSLKKASITFGLSKGDDTDAHYKKRLRHVVDTVANLKSHVAAFIRSHSDAVAAHTSMCDSFRYFYPDDQASRPKIDTMVARAASFKSAKDVLEAARAELESALAGVLEKERAVFRMLEERERIRIDIQHFEAQLPKLKEKAAKHPKDQVALDEMVAKRNEAQIKFDELEARLVPDLESFDEDIAKIVDGAITKWFDAEKLVHTQAAEWITEAQSATVSPLKEAAATAGAASAAAEGSASGATGEAAAASPAVVPAHEDVPSGAEGTASAGATEEESKGQTETTTSDDAAAPAAAE